jgi:protection-of-telomeres protein 1
MPLQLPNGFTAIKDATQPKSTVSLIGILVSFEVPKMTQGKDLALDFTIQDDFSSGDVGGESSITCRFFRPTEDKFPKIEGVGDVVILRNCQLQQYRFRMDAVGSRSSHMIVFPGSKIPAPELSQAFQCGSQKLPHASTGGFAPTIPEQMAVIHIKRASTGATPQVQQHAAISASKVKIGRKKSLIKDLQLGSFYDVCVQVVNIYYYQLGDRVDLKVTDYTPNEQLFYYADPDLEGDVLVGDRRWNGPYGYLGLNVTLYGVNAAWVQEHLGQGDYVFIRNMRTKLSERGLLEGALHEDKLNESQVDIRPLKNTAEIEAIDKRREEYEEKRGSKTAFQAMQNEPKKSSAKTKAEKRQAKKAKERAEKEAELEDLERIEREREKSRGGINTNGKIIYSSFFLY